MPYALMESDARHWPEVLDLTSRLIQLDAIDFPQAYLSCAAANYNLKNFAAAELNARRAQGLDAQKKMRGLSGCWD